MWVALILPQAWAVSTATSGGGGVKDPLEERAEELRQQGKWADACKLFNELMRADRAKYRERFQYCFRRLLQVQRHVDESYRRDALSLSYSQAIRLYELVLDGLQKHHVDRSRADAALLFRQGLEEFKAALDNPGFRSRYFPSVPDKEIQQLKARLEQEWGNKAVRGNADAVEQVREVAMAAQKCLDLDATAVVLEFACGACNALDDYTFYLTPAQYRSLFVAAKGRHFGVGIDLTARDNKMIVSRVLRGSPAYFAGIKIEDQVTHIGKKSTAEMTPEGAMDLLRGPVGTTVKVGITSDGMFVREIPLKRQKLAPRSVEFGMLWETISMSMERQRTDVGYVQIQNFQDSTPQELDTAIQALRGEGMKALVLDLRGNPGGSFQAAVDCARRFLASGVIVTAQDKDGKQTKYLVKAGDDPAAPLMVPLVVLVDGNTASSAEILAGALQGNGRAQLVGQTTYGKGCSQRLLRLEIKGKPMAGAIRITVAKFFSPKNGQPYSGNGLTPDHLVDNPSESGPMSDLQLDTARREAQKAIVAPMNMEMAMGRN
jgi:carboxyl-terminal processing protease